MESNIPDVEETVRQWGHGGVTFRSEDVRLQVSISVVDPAFFDVFDVTIDGGRDPLNTLSWPGSILIRK
jgi:hypothetical protein